MDSAEKQHLHTSTELRGHYILVWRWSRRLHDGLHVNCESTESGLKPPAAETLLSARERSAAILPST